MPKDVKLPQMGQTMEEGTIVTCMVKEGDHVEKGDVLFEIETDKVTLEVESPAGGFVKAVLAETGQTVPVNTSILVLGNKDEDIPQAYIDSLKAGGAAAASTEDTAAVSAPVVPTASAGQIFVKTETADAPTSPAGAVGAGQGMVYQLGQRIPVNRVQRIVAEKMLQSKREIPCFYLNIRVDMTELVRLRAKLNKSGVAGVAGGVKISFNDFIIKAVAMGLKHYSIMTGQLAGDYIQLADSIGVCLAISTDQGLVAPIVPDACDKSLRQIAACVRELVTRARADRLTLDDLTGGCITISNLGSFGIDSFIPIVVPGQASILGVGRINDLCVPMDGKIMIRKVMNLNLSTDHKVANGADAAQFLDFIKKTLEHTANFEE